MSDLENEIAEEMGEEEPDETGDESGDPESGGGDAADSPGDEAASQPRSQAEIEAQIKTLEKEAERHAKRVAQIMGDDFALLVPSPVDWTPGYLFNVPEMLPDEAQVGALLALLGRGDARDLRPAPDAEVCDTCNGWGVGLTGSKAEGQRTKPCKDCNGNGWRTKMQALAPVVSVTTPTPSYGTQPPPNQPFVAADQWGRPSGHPHYGLDPAQVMP